MEPQIVKLLGGPKMGGAYFHMTPDHFKFASNGPVWEEPPLPPQFESGNILELGYWVACGGEMGVPQNIMHALCAVMRPDQFKFASYGPDFYVTC